MRKIVSTGTLAGALLVGGAAGAMLFGSATARAQDPAASASPGASAAPATGTGSAGGTTPGTANGPGGHGRGGPGGGGGRVEAVSDMSVAATAIGISEADLTTAVNGGQTIAAVATAHNVDPQKVIDALVADEATEADAAVKAGTLTQAQADAEKAESVARMTARVNGTDPAPGGHGRGGPGGGGGRVEAVSDMSVAATAIGISEADLTTAVNGGQTIAAVATAHNVDPQKVIDALVADEATEADAAVKAGTLTQAQADAEKAESVARMTARVNGTDPGH